ncbi:MAG: hypothetical protein Q4G16_09685 [Cruoricaptor ignavus]|nr:hypothetical protein [Cruoricaptor ignavus]
MSSKEIKIQFYTILKKNWKSSDEKDTEIEPFYIIPDVLGYISKLAKKNKFYELKNNKFCFIDKVEINDNICSGYFKSARDQFRPNLLNKQTGAERKNPKEKTEGDIEKTHFVIRVDKKNEEVYLFLEHNHTGISILNFINYLKEFSKKYSVKNKLETRYSLTYQIIARNNFLTELEKLEQTKIAEIHVDKKILGNEFLKFSNRIVSIQNSVMLQVKAERKEDIKNFAVDIYNSFSKGKEDAIDKIRIYGLDENGNKTFIDTDFMGQIDFIPVQLDSDTGEAQTDDLLKQLNRIATNF